MSLPTDSPYSTQPTSISTVASPTHGTHTMDYQAPPMYDVAGNLMDLSNSTVTGTKMEDYYGMSGPMAGYSGYGHIPSAVPPKDTAHSTAATPQQPLHSSHSTAAMPQLGGAIGGIMKSSMPQIKTEDDNPNVPLSSSSSTHSDDSDAAKIPPKKRPLTVPDNLKDETYWEKRKKNNDSAKRSREARRHKEEQIAMRVMELERENVRLHAEVSLFKTEILRLRSILYN